MSLVSTLEKDYFTGAVAETGTLAILRTGQAAGEI
jgi:hypothetical protein